MKKTLITVALVGLALVGCQKEAQAQTTELGVQWTHNDVIEKDNGYSINGAVPLSDNVVGGVILYASSDVLYSYGAFVGLDVPVAQKVTFRPTASIEHYRDSNDTVAGLGAGLNYKLAPTVTTNANVKYQQSFDHSDFNGFVYGIGVTKHF